MNIPEAHIRLAQSILKQRVDSDLDVDGDFNVLSIATAKKWVGHLKVAGVMYAARWIALVIQYESICVHKTGGLLKLDAWYGPDTKDAAYRLMGDEHIGWRPDEDKLAPSSPRCWVPSERDMFAKYGQVGSNQVLVTLPFTMRLDWDLNTKVNKLSCHKLFAGPFTAALEETRDHYGLERIRQLGIDRTGGCLNVRKKRGGTTWSAHAWGVAEDRYPTANQLAWKKNRAVFAKPEYKPMRDAHRKAGLMSLGECLDFDWMHWQLNP
jgi:hypothetical protein